MAQGGGAFDPTTMCLYAYGTTRCLRLKPKTGSFAEASIRLLPCGSVGQSLRGAAVLQVPNNFVVAKKPLPLEPFQQPASHPFPCVFLSTVLTQQINVKSNSAPTAKRPIGKFRTWQIPLIPIHSFNILRLCIPS